MKRTRTEALRNLEVACVRFVVDIRRVIGGALIRLGRFVTSVGVALIPERKLLWQTRDETEWHLGDSETEEDGDEGRSQHQR